MTQLTSLALRSNQLTGMLPTEWSSMTQLTIISLASNQLTGTLPTEWSSMTQLEILSLESNQLTGTLPTEWSSMTQLIVLLLHFNIFTGTIPNAWTNMTNLRYVYLDNNQLSGEVPKFLLNLPIIQDLSVSNNNFTGAPLALPFSSPLLQKLILNHNNFTGTITSTLGNNAPQLDTILIQHNEFTGSLPPSLVELKQLSTFIAHKNGFHGQIPDGLGNASTLTSLVLAGNQLVGSIPTSLGDSKSLKTLVLRANKLSGTIPYNGFASNQNLRVLDLAQNNLNGVVPPFPANHSIEQLLLSSNALTGTISKELLQLKNLTRLEIDRNFLSCEMPQLNGTQLPSIAYPIPNNATNGMHTAFQSDMSMLVGNLFACPIDETLTKRDRWGAVYLCGWERIIGKGQITSPAGTTLASLTMATLVLVLRYCIPAAAATISAGDPVETKTPQLAVINEATNLLLYISSTLKFSCALGLVAAVLAMPAFVTAHSPFQCQYALTHTGAFKDGEFPVFLVEMAALLSVLILISWVVTQYVYQIQKNTEQKNKLKQSTDTVGDVFFVLSGSLEDRSENAINIEHPNGSMMSIDAVPVCQRLHNGDIRLPFEPAAVMWENATHHANESRHISKDKQAKGYRHHVVISSSGGLRKACHEASWKGIVKLIGCVIGCLIFGLAFNILYVLVESQLIPVSGNMQSIVTLLIAGLKKIANFSVAPAASLIGADSMRPSSKFMHARIRTSLKIWLTFFNTLGWPILTAIVLHPLCFWELLVPPNDWGVTYTYVECALKQAENKSYYNDCSKPQTVSMQANISTLFQWNTQCPSSILEIYGPLYVILFAYGIIGSAVSLLLTSHVFKQFILWKQKRNKLACEIKCMALCLNLKKVVRDGLMTTTKCCCSEQEHRKKKKQKKKKTVPRPTLGVVNLYSTSALNVAVIASFGFFYPSVAIVGVIHMMLSAYATRMQVNDMIACQKGTKSADLLRIEGASGLPVSAVIAVVGVNVALFFFVFGPLGMVKTRSIQTAAIVTPVLALVGVIFSKPIAKIWFLRAADQTRKIPAATRESAWNAVCHQIRWFVLRITSEERRQARTRARTVDSRDPTNQLKPNPLGRLPESAIQMTELRSKRDGGEEVKSDNGGESGNTNVRDMVERYVESFVEWSKMQERETELESHMNITIFSNMSSYG